MTDPPPILDCGFAEYSRVLLANDHPAMLALTAAVLADRRFISPNVRLDEAKPDFSRSPR